MNSNEYITSLNDKMLSNTQYGNLEQISIDRLQPKEYSVSFQVPAYTNPSQLNPEFIKAELIKSLSEHIANEILYKHKNIIEIVTNEIHNHGFNQIEFKGRLYISNTNDYIYINRQKAETYGGQVFTKDEITEALKKVYPWKWI